MISIASLLHTPESARPRVLIVDDDPAVRRVLRQVLDTGQYELLEADDGDTALDLYRAMPADAVLSDIMMPRMNGIDLLRAVKALDDTTAFILLTGAGSMSNAIDALRLEADDYLLKPFDVDEVQHSLTRALEHRRLLRENRVYQRALEQRVQTQEQTLDQLFVDGLLTIANAVEVRDHYTGGHVERVAVYAVATGDGLGMSPDELRDLAVAALLHDVGKIGIPDELLRKPAALNAEEYREMQRHPAIGAAILGTSPFLAGAIPGILHHHERWDGGGYPSGLAGEAISLAGRILAVVDTYDAIVTSRPYRDQRPSSVALAELQRCAGTQFDPRVVEAFTRALSSGFTSAVEISCIRALRRRDAAMNTLAMEPATD
jgi:putative two-component system response regulator